jgi:hypothetical protein
MFKSIDFARHSISVENMRYFCGALFCGLLFVHDTASAQSYDGVIARTMI